VTRLGAHEARPGSLPGLSLTGGAQAGLVDPGPGLRPPLAFATHLARFIGLLHTWEGELQTDARRSDERGFRVFAAEVRQLRHRVETIRGAAERVLEADYDRANPRPGKARVG
jgi:hypothetical protein